MEHDQKLNLVRDNTTRMADEFTERLDYLKGYFEGRYKPLKFEYFVTKLQDRNSLMIQVSLKGSERAITKIEHISPLGTSAYNFDVVRETCEVFMKGLEKKLVEMGVEFMSVKI